MKKRKAESYIKNALKPPKSFFDWCYSQIHTFKWSNKQRTILASERKKCKVIEKRLTKNSVLTFHDKFYSFCIVLVTKKRIEIQTYCFWSDIKDGKQEIEQELTNLEYIGNNQHIQVGRWWNSYEYGLVKMTSFGGPYTDTEDYENDWKEKIQTLSELKYIDFKNTNRLWISCLSRFYKYRKEIEFLQKIGANKIADELMTGHSIDMRTFSQKWLKENKQLLKNSTLNFNDFEMKRRISNRRGKVVPGIEKYMKYQDLNMVPAGVGIVKFQNWVIKNKINTQFYRDYMNLLKDLSIKPDTENLIIPKDLKKAHDNAVGLLNQLNIKADIKKKEAEAKKYMRRLKQIMKMEKTIGDYSFVVPKDLGEIVTEGKILSHCVGSSNYIRDHKNGKTTIVFVRDRNYQSTPLYTLEYRSGEIRQFRGKHNQEVPDDAKSAADKWLIWVNKGCKKPEKQKKRVIDKEASSAAA